MSVSLEIVPFSDSVDMYGEPDTSSAYSLSGHVSISISSTSSVFERSRAVRLLLRSLTVTFEGQSEVINSEFGYAPLRLCSVTHELAPSEAIELSNEGHEESDKPCKWNVVFNLPIPGWLPASARFCEQFNDEHAGTRYALYASANLVNLDDNSDKTWSMASFCSIFRPRTRMIHARQCPITLRRKTIPPAVAFSPESLFPMANYAVRATPEFSDAKSDSHFIPRDILSKIEVVTSVPEHISLGESSIPFSIRLRTSELEKAECKKIQITGFTVDVEQTEKYRALPPADSASRFPIPPMSSQPPNKPLLCPHSFIRIYESGLVTASADPASTLSRSYSLNEKEAGNYHLAGDNYIFANDRDSPEPSWYTVTTSIPIARRASSSSRALRASGTSPLFGVRHEMHIAVTCKYDAPNSSEPITERLHFSVPLHFSEITSVATSPSRSPSLSLPTSESTSSIASSEPLGQPEMVPYSLPAYSQLFDSNGDRKIDYSLPVYTPTAHSTPTPSDMEAAVHTVSEGKQLFTIVDDQSHPDISF